MLENQTVKYTRHWRPIDVEIVSYISKRSRGASDTGPIK